MTEVLGVNPLSPSWGAADTGGSEAMSALNVLVRERIAAREAARSARDYPTADAIRDGLTEAGVVVEDTAGGARWSLARTKGD
jgi:cysteinyl-tRNA synthetase